MNYAYYPGCSLEYTGKPYDKSVRAVFAGLGIGLQEIEDWNCCGATFYMSTNKLVGYAVSARNLAIAQKMGYDICAPCSSCYTILRKTNRHFAWNIKARPVINDALAAVNLSYNGKVDVRHPLDILVNDVGIERILDVAPFRFDGLAIAPYYGCQIVRPVYHFDDLEEPMTMDRLFTALGAKVVYYPGKVRCCGGMLMTTQEEVGLDLNHELIRDAEENGAEVIATACPMCQMNLEGYQPQINKRYGEKHHIPIIYFTQLVGLALGIKPKTLGLDTLLIRPADYKLKPKAVEVAV